MNTIDIVEIRRQLSNRLSKANYEHSVRTMETAIKLAGIHGEDVEKTKAAALLHDYSRDLKSEELINASRKAGLDVNWVEEKVPYLLHGPLGAIQVKTDLNIDDSEILSAIRNHTYGSTRMGPLDLIVYLADLIEPARDGVRIGKVRAMARDDLERAFRFSYQVQIGFLVDHGKYIHPKTAEVWNKIIDMENVNG